MATQISSSSLLLLLLFLLTIFASFFSSQPLNFTFHGFNQGSLLLDGAAQILNPNNGALKLTTKTNNVIGHAFYPNQIQFVHPFPPSASSFSTYFVLGIVSSGPERGGYGLAFTVSPAPSFPGAEAGQFLGILSSSNNGNSTNHVFAVEFDTVKGFDDASESFGNHVGINVNNMSSLSQEPASYYGNNNQTRNDVDLESDGPIQAWVEYDGVDHTVNVTIAPWLAPKPARPLLSLDVDLSLVLKETMYVGFSAATGIKSSSHYILGWSFRLNGVSDPLDLSKLPPLPKARKSSNSNVETKVFLPISILVLVLLVAILLAIVVYRRRTMNFEGLEDWERDCPHRFRYKDLYVATKGFKESEIVGVGGFGAVYKGVLPSNGSVVAIKKISTNNNLQGMREFTAEIESLGRVRHKNLVNLQGWCKKKSDLLLVYDFIPNGSLNSQLFGNEFRQFLSWENRFKIVKGIAEGLLYLHEEWEKVVIHRDVKSSNVLIDSDMNGRLGDFGLARLYDHDKNSHTTSLVGTIGYIAPELARTGKASASSDVFAYGVLLLEVVSGRKPIFSDPPNGQVALVDWVIQRFQSGGVLEAIDRKMGSSYVVEEVELVLGLGLLCTRSRTEGRPSMRQVVKYLNGDETVPVIDQAVLSEARAMDERMMRFLQVINGPDGDASSSSSMAGMFSNSSFNDGR